MLNEDFLDLLSALLDADVKFMIVGAYAVGVHARPRATKDLDVWVEASAENSAKAEHAGERLQHHWFVVDDQKPPQPLRQGT